MDSKKMAIDLSDSEQVKKIVNETESGMYSSETEDGEKVVIFLDKGKAMDVKVYQPNGWIRVDEYGENGYKQSETFDGKWNK